MRIGTGIALQEFPLNPKDASSPGGARLVTDGVATVLSEAPGVGSPPPLGLFTFPAPPGVVASGVFRAVLS